jgi:predicted nucleic acid-binding protein
MPGSFFDTNVLVSIASGDPMKADRAETIIGHGGVMSVQVLNELTNVTCRKMRLSWPETRSFLSVLRSLLTVQPITVKTYETGLALAERYNLSTYDAMIVVRHSTLIAKNCGRRICSTAWGSTRGCESSTHIQRRTTTHDFQKESGNDFLSGRCQSSISFFHSHCQMRSSHARKSLPEGTTHSDL